MGEEAAMVMESAYQELAPAPVKGGGGGGGGKKKRKQKREGGGERRKECRLVSYHELPDYMKENEFILNYYRSEWPILNAVLSLFSWHNETINIWTHLLGFVVFFGLTVLHLGQYFPQVADLIGHLSWPISKVAENVSSNIGDVLSVRRGVAHAGEPGGAGGGGAAGGDDAVAVLRVPRRRHVLPAEQRGVPPPVVPLPPPQPVPDPPRLHRHRRHDRGVLLPADLLHLPVRAAVAGGVPVGDHRGRRGHRVRAHVAQAERRQVPRPPRAAVRRHGPLRRRPGRPRRRRQLARAAPERDAGVRGRHGAVLPHRHGVLPLPRAGAVVPRQVRPLRPQPPDLPRPRHRRRARPLRRRHGLHPGARRDGLPGLATLTTHRHSLVIISYSRLHKKKTAYSSRRSIDRSN
uniref:Uncharacterized protein n=1 Tax=Oryza brachyantha TaxID=4533 RepID=J3MG74_ORYBR